MNTNVRPHMKKVNGWWKVYYRNWIFTGKTWEQAWNHYLMWNRNQTVPAEWCKPR